MTNDATVRSWLRPRPMEVFALAILANALLVMWLLAPGATGFASALSLLVLLIGWFAGLWLALSIRPLAPIGLAGAYVLAAISSDVAISWPTIAFIGAMLALHATTRFLRRRPRRSPTSEPVNEGW